MAFIFLISFTWCDALQLHPCCCQWHYSILFYGRGEVYVVYMYHIFIHSSVGGRLGCSCVLAFVNSATVNTRVPVSFQIRVFSGHMPSSGTAESQGNSIFGFLRNFHTVLHSGYTNLHSYQECRRLLHTVFTICYLQSF